MSLKLAVTAGALAALGVAAVVASRSEQTPAPAPAQQAPRPPQPSPPTPQPAGPGRSQPRPAPPTRQMEAADEAAIEQFKKDIQAYVDIHTAAEKALPKLPTEATIHQIDQNQRSLLVAIAGARKGARRGDILKPAMETTIRRVMTLVFEGVEGRQLRESIMEENPRNIRVTVNGRYPDTVPLATMPPEVLAALPKMPEELEYRFVGDALAIMDVHAHMIVDFVPNALPR